MKNSIKILSLILAIIMVVAVFGGCAKESKKEKKDTSAVSGRETEIVTDENGETTVVYVDDTGKTTDKKTENDTSEIGGKEEEGTSGGTSSEKGKSTAETTGAGKEKKKTPDGEKSADTTGSGYKEIVIPAETREKKDPGKAVLPDGIAFESVGMSRLDDTVSIEFTISNSSGEERELDFSYIVMKVNNKTEIVNTFDVMTIAPGENVFCSMPIEDESVNLSLGTSVTVYFGNDLIDTVTVEMF